MRGRKPKPTALHRLQGTHNPTRHGRDRAREPIAEGDIEEPPIDLTDSQAELWRECLANMPPGVLKRIDKKVLAVFVEAADRHNIARNMQAILDSDPGLKLLAKGPNGTLVPSPYNAIMKETGDMILKCADRLGFCPTARPRIKLDDPAGNDKLDAWAPLRLKVLPGGRTD
jgi:P27 family predicted phage terminase small subunit